MYKKLFMMCLAACMAPAAFAETDQLDSLLKQKAQAAYSANAIRSVLEVSFDVKTVFSVSDILDKNHKFLSAAYMVPGTTPKNTVWDLSRVEAEWVILDEPYEEYGPAVIINQNGQDKQGNSYSVVPNYNYKKKGCSMFLIDENWLMGSVECIGSEKEGAVGDFRLANTPYEIVEKTVTGDLHFGRNQKAPAKGRIFQGANVVLVYIGGTQTQKLMAGKPKANVLFFKNNIFSLLSDGTTDNTFKIRTSRFGTGAIRNRSLKMGSYQNGHFKLNDQLGNLSATGGDPLFYTDKSSGAQYLVGFNAGKITATTEDTGANLLADYQGEVVNRFYDFHLKDYNFVKKTISSKSASDWNRIKSHLIIK